MAGRVYSAEERYVPKANRALVFKKLRDGRLHTVIEHLDCYTPPIPSDKAEFINGDITDRKSQKWNRGLAYPTEQEIERLSEREQESLRVREARRLKDGGGAWFFNDGEPTYLTPDHYFFLTHCKLPDLTYPIYYEADVEDFMWTDAIEADEYCIGGVMMGARQRGKTARRAARKLRKAMVTPGAHLGIQSKTESDAKGILTKFISHFLRELSDLIRPVTNLATDDAKRQIDFKSPARKGQKGIETKRKLALNSKIEARNSKDNAFDGETLYELLSDEWAKKQDYDAEKRLTVVSRMLWGRDGKRKGRIWMYSTIDEDEDFEVEMPQRVWGGSDPLQRGGNGRTKTGLVRNFITALKAAICDDYGRSNIALSSQEWEANAPDKEADPIAYRRYCRANPRTPEDGFASANRDSTFNLDALDAARDANTAHFNAKGRYHWGTYNLDWEDAAETKVKYVPTKSGRFRIVIQALPADLNAVQADGAHTSILGTFVKYKPLHEARNVCGCDPYNARKVRDLGAASRAAAYAFWKPDELHERERFIPGTTVEQPDYWPSDSFFIEYINRPATPHVFFEDMIKMCHLLGAPILIENNKDALLAHMEDRGYAAFFGGKTSIRASENQKQDKKKGKNETDGMAASTGTTEQWAERISGFTHGPLIQDYRRMPFNDQIASVTNLNLAETKKYDAAVATGWTLLYARRFRRVATPPPPRESYALSSHFDLAPL